MEKPVRGRPRLAVKVRFKIRLPPFLSLSLTLTSSLLSSPNSYCSPSLIYVCIIYIVFFFSFTLFILLFSFYILIHLHTRISRSLQSLSFSLCITLVRGFSFLLFDFSSCLQGRLLHPFFHFFPLLLPGPFGSRACSSRMY